MKILLCIFLALFFASAHAKEVRVKGYTRKDGTYVAPHTRSAPNHTKSDNYSTKGNVNPYTGKAGTKSDSSATPSLGVAGSEKAGAIRTAASADLTAVKPGMTKAEVAATLGEPSLKTSSKWVYSGGGTVLFGPDGLAK